MSRLSMSAMVFLGLLFALIVTGMLSGCGPDDVLSKGVVPISKTTADKINACLAKGSNVEVWRNMNSKVPTEDAVTVRCYTNALL